MKKRKWIIAIIILAFLALIPIPTGAYRDGGTRTYTALTYKIVDWHHIYGANDIYDEIKVYPFPMNFLSMSQLLDIEEDNFEDTDIYLAQSEPTPTFPDTLGQNTQYIRTGSPSEGVTYPQSVVIRSVQQLQAYYEANKELYTLERRTDVASDSTIGFLDACDRYDEAYFADRILILVLLEEGSGSIRHKVTNVFMDENGTLNIKIDVLVPEVGTCDMALWHLFIEPDPSVQIADESDIRISLNSVDNDHLHQYAQQPQTVADPFVGYCGNTWTTIHFDSTKKYGFMLGESVTLTDILLNLHYDPYKTCRCPAEYTVDTEFHTGYEINLTEGFARCDKGQADLTQEQVKQVAEIIEWAKEKAEQEASA